MNLKRKTLIILIVTIAMFMIVAQSTVNATSQKVFNLSHQRYLYNKTSGEYERKYEYAINGSRERPIFQILSWNATKTAVTGTDYFCLDANTSASWYGGGSSDTATKVTYSSVNAYDLTKAEGKSKIKSNYNQIMWLLDNMYIASKDSG